MNQKSSLENKYTLDILLLYIQHHVEKLIKK